MLTVDEVRRVAKLAALELSAEEAETMRGELGAILAHIAALAALDDRRAERFDPSIAGSPDLLGPRTSLTLYEGMTGIAENAFINVKSRSHTITAEIEVPRAAAEGVIVNAIPTPPTSIAGSNVQKVASCPSCEK